MTTSTTYPSTRAATSTANGRLKFLLGGGAIIVAIVFLVATTLQSTGQRFLSVAEMQQRSTELTGHSLRVSGAVLGDTITIDSETLTITFTMSNMPVDAAEIDALGGLAAVLDAAALDPDSPRVQVVYVGPKPDLLQDRAQAIVTGKLGEDGVFYADELLLKCPTRYEEASFTPAAPQP